MRNEPLRRARIAVAVVIAVTTTTALAQRDLAGMWGQRFHEDLPERGAGPDIGDYTGLPVNDGARLRADSWNAAKWTMPGSDTSAARLSARARRREK